MPRSYYRVRLGEGSEFAQRCRNEGWIGGDWGIGNDLSKDLTDDWRSFNAKYIPIYLQKNPGKTRVVAGLACGMLHTIAKGIRPDDVVLCPNGKNEFFIGKVTGDYFFAPNERLPHRRHVQWFDIVVPRPDISDLLWRSVRGPGTAVDITQYAAEMESLIAGRAPALIVATDATIEDPVTFALERHLEDFLVQNWSSTELGKDYDIYALDGEIVGQQFQTDTGPIDILAVSKDSRTLLVVELKRGRASDAVVGQVQRYMGYVQQELAEQGQLVRGCIIALEDDVRVRRALAVTQNIDLYRYQVSFKLAKQKRE